MIRMEEISVRLGMARPKLEGRHEKAAGWKHRGAGRIERFD